MRSRRRIAVVSVVVGFGLLGGSAAPGGVSKFHGPLRVSSVNPRYFTDDTGKAIYLTGTHIWNNLQDEGPASSVETLPTLDYDRYLQFLRDNGHNFMRMWMWEQPRFASWNTTDDYFFSPIPYARSSVCCALDGGNKFDLTEFNPAFFQRLRERVVAAGEQGIYVSVMLFEGWSIFTYSKDPWPGNPYNGANNVNGVDATDYASGFPPAHSHLPNPAVWPYQKAYIDHIVDAVGDLDNVLYEVSNEDPAPPDKWLQNLEWQNQVVDEIHSYEDRPGHERHPVGITRTLGCGGEGGVLCATNQQIADTHADWFSPGPESYGPYDPGDKVVIWDTDHITGVGITDDQAWKAFLSGWNPISMDHSRYTSDSCDVGPIDPEDGIVPLASDWRSSCGDLAMRDTARYATKMDLIHMVSQPSVCSTGYCLVNTGHEYLVYQPRRTAFTLTLAPGRYAVEWFDTKTHTAVSARAVDGRSHGYVAFKAPFNDPAVLYLRVGE
jgi:hypothetical protein